MKSTLPALLLGLYLCGVGANAQPPLSLVKTIPLGDIPGRIDHMYVDTEKERLYVAALTNDTLEVVDLKQGKRVRSLTGPRGPQGVTILPATHEVVVASGEDGVFRLYDETLNLVRFVSELEDADAVRYDKNSGHIYVAYGKALAIIDPKGPAKLADIPFECHPESFQMEVEGSNIYVNLPETRQVAVVSKDTSEITAKWDLTEAHENYSMALDETNNRVFIGCRKPSKVLIYDTKNASYIGKVDCVDDTDDMYYDRDRRCIYASGGQGYVTVITQVDTYLYKVQATVPSAPGARTSYFEPQSGMLYLAVPQRHNQPAEIWVYKAQP